MSEKPRIEIFYFEMPYVQAFLDYATGQAKVGGTPGLVKVRLAANHGIWEAGENIRDAIKRLLKSCKLDNLPYFIEDYEVVLVDTVRCNAYYSDGREVNPITLSQLRSQRRDKK
jgi:hypothetical protein